MLLLNNLEVNKHSNFISVNLSCPVSLVQKCREYRNFLEHLMYLNIISMIL
jgi:hypothetical protein